MSSTPESTKSPGVLHVPRLVLSHHSHGTIHGTGPVGRFNTWLAVKITKTVGTMWIAYLFAAIALISFPAAIRSGDVIIIVAWIAPERDSGLHRCPRRGRPRNADRGPPADRRGACDQRGAVRDLEAASGEVDRASVGSPP